MGCVRRLCFYKLCDKTMKWWYVQNFRVWLMIAKSLNKNRSKESEGQERA